MGEEKQTFNLQVLLRLGDLDIRRIVANDPTLTAKEYCDSLWKFIDLFPKAGDILVKMPVVANDKDAFQCLVETVSLLNGLGEQKIAPVIRNIIGAIERGDTEFAVDCAKDLLNDFADFCTRIKTAIKTDNLDNWIEILCNDGITSLNEVLSQIDNEEAVRKLRILAVDDTSIMLKTITSTLSDEYKVYTLTDPTLVEKFLQQITPDLFLLDYKMPKLSGFDLVPIIRNFEEHKDTPIIFLTSMGTNDHVSTAAMLGACDYILKPIQKNILCEKVAKHIAKKKLF
jgi:CheY-like chemotaxis protein